MRFTSRVHTRPIIDARRLGFAVVTLALILGSPLRAQPTPDATLDTDAFQPIPSAARTVADIVREAGNRRPSREEKVGTADSARGQGSGLGLSRVEKSRTKKGSASYQWEVVESWLPGDKGIQWCVGGAQSVEPIGGVKLYQLSGTYDGLRSLEPWSLAVTLKAQEQVPSARRGRAASGSMPHQFDYGTCVTPELTRVGTYATAVVFCGSAKECAQNPHVLATRLDVKPFLVSFDSCIDRSAGVVNVFVSALYFDQRPTSTSIQLLLDGASLAGAQPEASGPWLLIDYEMSLADYEKRFGAAGGSAKVSIASDSTFIPKAELFFMQSDWLDPCRR